MKVFGRIIAAMNKQLKVFAAFGIVAVALLALRTLFLQNFPMLLEECMALLNIKPNSLSREEVSLLNEKIDMVYHGCNLIIYALSYRLLELAYASIGGSKKTRSCAHWGMVGCRLAFICILLCLLRDVLLCPGGAVTVMLATFSFASSCVLGVSVVLLARVFCTNAVLVKMSVIGAFGWFFIAFDDLLFLLPSVRTDWQRFIRDHWLYYCYFGYATEAFRLLPFIGFLFARKKSLHCADDDSVPDGGDEDADEREKVWNVCAMPLFWLVFVAIPLCILPLCISYPRFTKHLFFVSYRVNVLAFRISCFLVGAIMAFVNFRTVLPYLNRTDLGRLLGTFGERLRKFAYVMCAVKQIRLPRWRNSSAAGKENAPAPKARDRLAELKQLLDDGLITQAEFEQKRASILSEV